MNLRQNVNRKVTYSIVTLRNKREEKQYIVYGKTTVQQELLKYLRSLKNANEELPVITVKVITERRTMEIDKFIENSILINESEENNNE